MGYSLSTELKKRYLAREPQICNILVSFLSGTTQPNNVTQIVLTEEDIASSGLNIDRALFTGNTLELGTAISAEATVILNNTDGRFNDYHFEGAKLEIFVGLRSDGRSDSIAQATEVKDATNTTVVKAINNVIPMGTFWVDNCPRQMKKITLSCLDSFAKMDLVIPDSNNGISSTRSIALYEMISQICSKIGLTLYATSGDSFSSYLQSLFPNTHNKQVVLPQIDGKLTYRALLQYCLQILGGYAFMDWDDKVHIAKYGSSAISPAITAAERYTSDIQENRISVTGVSVTYKDNDDTEQTSLYGTTDYAVSISGNPLVTTENVSGMAQSIKSQTFGSRYYYPFSAKCKPMIWLYPLDKVSIKNQSGTSVSSYVTNTNFTLNGIMVIESKGETKYKKGWASFNGFTAQQTSVIEAIARQDRSDLRQKYQDVLNLNELLAKSMGLWTKRINGIYYFYSMYGSSVTTAPLLTEIDLSYGLHEGKDVIYTFGSNGLGVSTCFNETITTEEQRNALDTEEEILNKLLWNYGITKEGNAVLNSVKAYQISADYIQTGILSSYDKNTYFNLDNSEICTSGILGGNKFKTYFRGGDIEFYGSISTGLMGKTAKMRTGYSVSGDTTTKHFAIGYISNDNGGVDGAGSLKLGAFQASNDQFIDILELSGLDGAVFGTSSQGVNAKTANGHFESNTLKTDGETVTTAGNFSTGLKHYSASMIEGKGAWRQHYFGSYVDSNKEHWTGWTSRNTDNDLLHSFCAKSEKYDDYVYFRIDNGKGYTSYIGVNPTDKKVAFRSNYGNNFSYDEALDLYCKCVYAENLHYRNSNDEIVSVTSRLSDLYNTKTSTSVTGTEQIGSETHYDTLDRHNGNLGVYYKMLRDSVGWLKVGFHQSAGGEDHDCTYLHIGQKNNSDTDIAAYHGTIAVSTASNFAFYKGNGKGSIHTNIYVANVYTTSTEESKKNISSSTINAISLLETSRVYNYDYKTEEDYVENVEQAGNVQDNGSSESGETSEEISVATETGNNSDFAVDGETSEEATSETGSNLGFVIGRETPEEVISKDGSAVNLYSFTSLTWLACQQLLDRVKDLEAKINKLENS